jgi:hypothetical protein
MKKEMLMMKLENESLKKVLKDRNTLEEIKNGAGAS